MYINKYEKKGWQRTFNLVFNTIYIVLAIFIFFTLSFETTFIKVVTATVFISFIFSKLYSTLCWFIGYDIEQKLLMLRHAKDMLKGFMQ